MKFHLLQSLFFVVGIPLERKFLPALFAGVVVTITVLASTWWWVHGPVKQHLTLYYADKQGRALVPVEEDADFIRPDAPGPWAQAVFEKLGAPARPDLVPVVDAQMILVDASWSPPIWTVTVKLPSTTGTTSETLLVSGVVRTLLDSYPGANKVRMRLLGSDNKPLLSQHLDLSEPLTKEDVANLGDPAPQAASLTAAFWWKSKSGRELIPVTMPLTGHSGIPPRDALETLLAGPQGNSASFLAGIKPAGLQANWAKLEGTEAQIDLVGPVNNDVETETFVKSVVLTLTEYASIKQVRFWKGGAPVNERVGAFDLSVGIARPASVNVVRPQ